MDGVENCIVRLLGSRSCFLVLASRERRNGQGNGHQYIIRGHMGATVAHAPLRVGKSEEGRRKAGIVRRTALWLAAI